MNEKWSKCADENADVLCLKVSYPWQFMPLSRTWASNRQSELDLEYEREAQPLLQQFLQRNRLSWNDEGFGDLTLSTFVAYYVAGGHLITPACCYTHIPTNAELIKLPLSAVPL